MDILIELVESLDKQDKENFSIFLNRHQQRKSRKDHQLFELLSKTGRVKKNDTPTEMYPGHKDMEAYHATRKRLFRQLIEFILLNKSKEIDTDSYEAQLISMSKYLFNQARNQAAWVLLRQAEALAIKNENYTLLNELYTLQITQSQIEGAPDLNEIILLKKKYQRLSLEEDNAHIAYHLIRQNLQQSLSAGTQINISEIISRILAEYNINEAVDARPRLMFNIIAIARSAVLAEKRFYDFEPYIVQQFLAMEKMGKFTKYTHYYKVQLLYMIAHVLYRNKKFKEAETYLGLLHASMLEHNKIEYQLLLPKHNLLLAAVYNYSDRNGDAIELLEKLLSSKKYKLSQREILTINLNLSTYYFQKENFRKSTRVFQNINHSDQWLKKTMGYEWVLKKNIMECINQFELGNTDIVANRISLIEKNFSEYFNWDLYKRVKTFLSFVKKINGNPQLAKTKAFAELVEASFVFSEVEKEDIQAMSFYGWLKAKMLGRKYYEVLLELLGTE